MLAHKKETLARRGFTLIEILIAVGLFALLATLLVTSSFSLIGNQRLGQNNEQILNELRLVIDLTGKEILSGSAFPNGCTSGCTPVFNDNPFEFTTKPRPDMNLRVISYAVKDHTIMKAEQKTSGLCKDLAFDTRCYQPYSSQKLSITSLTFYVNNKTDTTKPIITVAVQGTIQPNTPYAESFEFSSSFSPRLVQDPNAKPPRDTVRPSLAFKNPVSAGTNANASFTSNNSRIDVDGIATDNVAVSRVSVSNTLMNFSRNNANSYIGLNTPSTSWFMKNIPLASGLTNNIKFTAFDAEGNNRSITLAVTSTRPQPAPTVPFFTAFQDCRNENEDPPPPPVVYLYGEVTGFPTKFFISNIEFYKCTGVGCTPSTLITTGNSGYARSMWDHNVEADKTYGYCARSYNSKTNSFSPCSQTKYVSVFYPAPRLCSKANPNFNINVSKDTIKASVTGETTTKSDSTNITITVTPKNSFKENVLFSAKSLSQSLIIKNFFNPKKLSSADYSTGSSFFVRIPGNTAIGDYSIEVKGTSEDSNTTSVKNITLHVSPVKGGQR